MDAYCYRAACFCIRSDFLDLTEEEVADLGRSMLKQLHIVACFAPMPDERRKMIKQAISSF